jgi:hypothetical protein
MSAAGVHRRAMRRTYGAGANLGYHPVARAALYGAAAAGAGYYGAGYGGWGGGWGDGGWNRPLYASAALGTDGNGYGIGSGCTTTYDDMTGWNYLFCPGSGYVYGGPITTSPAYASDYGTGTGYSYPASAAYRTANHPAVRGKIYATAAGVRRYGQ